MMKSTSERLCQRKKRFEIQPRLKMICFKLMPFFLMNNIKLTNLSIQAATKLIREKQISSAELVDYYLGRIETKNKELNAFITVNERARLDAKQADNLLAKGESGNMPLLGIPIALKDIFSTSDLRTTAASKVLKNYLPPYNATVVSRL